MPMHPVTSTLMYRGICTIPDILSYGTPVNLPEDEVEGESKRLGHYIFRALLNLVSITHQNAES